MMNPVRRSPVSRAHGELGATMMSEAGWELPASYGDEPTERDLLRREVAIVDITARGKIDLRGEIGSATAIADDLLVARITPDRALVLTEPGAEEDLMCKLELAVADRTMVTDATHLYAGFALAGPSLPEVLARATEWDLSTLEPGHSTGAQIAEIRGVLFRRQIDMALLEIYVGAEWGRYAWETLLGIVRAVGGAPVGWNALRAEGWR